MKNTNTIVMLKGCSGVGKGTRVNQFLSFLKEKGFKYQEEFHSYINGKGKEKTISIGLLFPELKIFFLGQYKVSNKSGLTSWSSLDIYNAAFGAEKNSIFLKDLFQKRFTDTIVILEGYPLTMSFRFRPAFFFEEFGVEKVYMQYYFYTERSEYEKRVYNRSGKLPKKESNTWDSNVRFKAEYDFIIEGKPLNSSYERDVFIKNGCKSYPEFKSNFKELVVTSNLYSAPFTIFGAFMCNNVLKDTELFRNFLNYSFENDCLRSVENPME